MNIILRQRECEQGGEMRATRETCERCKKDGESKGGRADSSRGEIGSGGRGEEETKERERKRKERGAKDSWLKTP